MAATQTLYTVQEAARKTGVSEHTLRYYEKASLLFPIGRTGAGRHRRYTDDNLKSVVFLRRLRSTGMPIREMQRYVALHRAGDPTIAERRALLCAHRDRVRAEMETMRENLDAIAFKIKNLETLGTEGDGATGATACGNNVSVDLETDATGMSGATNNGAGSGTMDGGAGSGS